MESKCDLSVHQRVYETRLNGKEKPQNMMCIRNDYNYVKYFCIVLSAKCVKLM